jgi:putative SOS response-associated peptidase YedK
MTQRQPISALASLFASECRVIWDRPQYNIAPPQGVLAVRQFDVRTLDLLHWGLIPFRAKSASKAAPTASAHAVVAQGDYRPAFEKRRCLIVADGYFERLRKNSRKPPVFYEVDGGQAFAIAGIWQQWHNLETCCIITTSANDLVADVEDTMPAILNSRDYSTWLNPKTEPASLRKLLVPFDASRMSARPVSSFVKDANNQGPQCIAPP